MNMKIVIALITIIFFSASSFACDCDWGGDFFTMIHQTDLVAKVRVTKKIKDANGFNTKMEVELMEVFKGQETRKKITIWGDDGKECRPYIDYFETEGVYYLSLYKYDNEYEQMNCGEMYLKIEGNNVLGEKGIRKDLPQVGKTTVQEFEQRLRKNEPN
jgi:hypothetical protein